MAAAIRDFLAQCMTHAEAGTLPPKGRAEVDLPAALVEALDADPELAEAFHALTPGRQKSHVLQVNGAKTLATKQARIARARPKILAGKGATER